jgi:hypothetical protein
MGPLTTVERNKSASRPHFTRKQRDATLRGEIQLNIDVATMFGKLNMMVLVTEM